MQWKSVLRISMVVIPVMIVCGLLVLASSMGPTAWADNAGSANGLEGTWRVQVTVRESDGRGAKDLPGRVYLR
jgi:hypothetical protein